jgi:hypothetical protein
MNRRHNTTPWIMHEHRNAIRRAHRHRYTGLIGHQGVPPAGELIRLGEWTIHHQGICPMYLIDGQQPTTTLHPRLTSRHSYIECQ